MFLIDADRMRLITENLAVVLQEVTPQPPSANPVLIRRKRGEPMPAQAAAEKIRTLLPDFDHPPEDSAEVGVYYHVAWDVYRMRYADKMDTDRRFDSIGGWAENMEHKYGSVWPLPGFPAVRAMLDVSHLVGKFDKGVEGSLWDLCMEAWGKIERPGRKPHPHWTHFERAVRRLCFEGCGGMGVHLMQDPALEATLNRYGIEYVPDDPDFGKDWLPDQLSDCGIKPWDSGST